MAFRQGRELENSSDSAYKRNTPSYHEQGVL